MTPWDVARHDDVHHPQQRRKSGEEQRRRVHAARELHDDRERGRVTPPFVAQRPRDQRDEPGDRAPRHEDDGDARRVLEEVRTEHVRERRDDDAGPAHPQRAHEVEHAEPGCEQERAEPQTLRDPGRKTRLANEPVEGTSREHVPDVLVRGGPECDVGTPQVRRSSEETTRVEVEELLRVDDHAPRRAQQQRNVCEQSEQRVPDHAPAR